MWNFLELIVSPTSRLLPFANYRQSFHYVMGENGTRAWCNLRTNKLAPLLRFIALTPRTAQGIPRSECGGTRWRTGGEVKGKLENGVGSRYCHTISGRGVSSITNADAHTSAASSRLNGLPRWFKWTRPFRRKTKSGFCACAIRFRTSFYYVLPADAAQGDKVAFGPWNRLQWMPVEQLQQKKKYLSITDAHRNIWARFRDKRYELLTAVTFFSAVSFREGWFTVPTLLKLLLPLE